MGSSEIPGRIDRFQYLHFLQTELPLILQDVKIRIEMWLQDGGLAHYSHALRNSYCILPRKLGYKGCGDDLSCRRRQIGEHFNTVLQKTRVYWTFSCCGFLWNTFYITLTVRVHLDPKNEPQGKWTTATLINGDRKNCYLHQGRWITAPYFLT